MKDTDCPPWIDPGNAFRINVCVDKYIADVVEYGGRVEMVEQEHVVWFDLSTHCTLSKFVEEMAARIIWGSGQQLLVWGVDKASGTEWKIVSDDQFREMIEARWEEGEMFVNCEVLEKDKESSRQPRWDAGKPNPEKDHSVPSVPSVHGTSAVTSEQGNPDTIDDASSGPDHSNSEAPVIDWSTFTIIPDEDLDGDATVLVNEELLYEAMGFTSAEEGIGGDGPVEGKEIPVPVIPPELQEEMDAAAMKVDDNDNEGSEPLFFYDRDNPDMSVGTLYPSMPEFRMAVKQHAIVKEFELGTEKSDKTRFRGHCKAEGCPWKIRARTQRGGIVRIQINRGEHTCASTARVLNKMASQGWIANRAVDFLKDNPTMGAKALRLELEKKYPVKINYQTCWYGRQRAADKLFGKWEDSFDWLYRFKAEVELRSPGSVVEIDTVEVDSKIHFSRFFCAFKACIDGFRQGCRPYISVDATALNGQWNGQLAAATGLDGHNWMFPIAFGFFDTETKDNWIWFMQQLAKALGPVQHLAVCTDACKGLEVAVKEVFPMAEQRECFRHLMENMKKKFSGSTYGGQYMWPAARAYTEEKFERLMAKALEGRTDILAWLNEHHKLKWSRSKFSEEIKCDYINNNLAETYNAWIKEFKDLPLDSMADAIRIHTMQLFEKRRKIAEALSGDILPAVIQQLNAASKGLSYLKVLKGNSKEAEVTVWYNGEEIRRHVLYLEEQKCTCREWQVSGRPCPHALAVITTERQPNMNKYVHETFSVKKLKAAYAGYIPHMTDKQQWPKVDKGFTMLPPVVKQKKGPGRTKKKRHLGCLERGTGRLKRQVICKGCGEPGHRATSWRCKLTGTKKRTRTKKTATKPRRKKQKTAAEEVVKDVEETPRAKRAAAREESARKAAAAKAAQQAARHEEEEAATEDNTAASPRLEEEPAMEENEPAMEENEASPSCKRRLDMVAVLDAPPALEAIPPAEASEVQPPKKMTPRRKQLSRKIKKATPTKPAK